MGKQICKRELLIDPGPEREARDSMIRKLWATGKYTGQQLADQFRIQSRARIGQICKGVERNMERVCIICNESYTARVANQKICASPECNRKWTTRLARANRHAKREDPLLSQACPICGEVVNPARLGHIYHPGECRKEANRRLAREHYRRQKRVRR